MCSKSSHLAPNLTIGFEHFGNTVSMVKHQIAFKNQVKCNTETCRSTPRKETTYLLWARVDWSEGNVSDNKCSSLVEKNWQNRILLSYWCSLAFHVCAHPTIPWWQSHFLLAIVPDSPQSTPQKFQFPETFVKHETEGSKALHHTNRTILLLSSNEQRLHLRQLCKVPAEGKIKNYKNVMFSTFSGPWSHVFSSFARSGMEISSFSWASLHLSCLFCCRFNKPKHAKTISNKHVSFLSCVIFSLAHPNFRPNCR